MRSRNWILIIKIIISVGLLVLLAKRLSVQIVRPILPLVPLIALCGIAIGLSGIALMASRWKILILAATGKIISFKDLFSYNLVGILFSNILPGAVGGDFVKAKYLVSNHEIPIKTALKISVIERMIGLCGVLFLIFATAPYAIIPQDWKTTISSFVDTISVIGSIGCIVACVVLCRSFKEKPMSATSIISVCLMLLIAQMSDVLILSICLRAQNLHIDGISLIFSVGVAYIAASLPISVGGLGVREGILVSLFALNGIPVPAAAAASVLLLCTRLLVSVCGAGVYLVSSSSKAS